MDGVGVFIFLSSILKHVTSYLGRNDRPKSCRKVGKVTNIWLYPFKSMAGVSLGSSHCSHRGLLSQGVLDRQWMVVLCSNHQFVSARMQPSLVKVKATIVEDGLKLEAEGVEPFTLDTKVAEREQRVVDAQVWGQDVPGIDMGDEAAAWIEKYLNKSAGTYRILYHTENLRPRCLVNQKTAWDKDCKPDDKVQFQDGYPYLLISQASLADLNQRVSARVGEAVDMAMERFRPNIEVDGCQAYEEDDWEELFIGDVKFSNKKPCGRCVFVTVDPFKGEKSEDKEPLKTLKSYRPADTGAPSFGINLVVDRPGTISVGDPVYVI